VAVGSLTVTAIDIRPMTHDDVPAVRDVVQAADDDAERRAGRQPEPSTPEGEAFFRAGRSRRTPGRCAATPERAWRSIPPWRPRGRSTRRPSPRGLPGRAGDTGDLDLVADVDAGLRGSRAEDVEFMLAHGARMDVVDAGSGRGYVVHRRNRVSLLGATDDAAATQVLWRFLAATEGKASIWCLTAGQDWAVRVALAARLTVVPAGPLFVDGLDRPPGPWVPGGWYF
jgi:hypothetical protein